MIGHDLLLKEISGCTLLSSAQAAPQKKSSALQLPLAPRALFLLLLRRADLLRQTYTILRDIPGLRGGDL